MWTLLNHTPFPAHAGFLRDHTGQSWWQIWIKGTFAIGHDRAPSFVADQIPLNLGPAYADDDPAGLMVADTDLAHHKPRVDLTLHVEATPERDAPRDLSFQMGKWLKVVRLCPPQTYAGWRGAARIDPDQKAAPVTLDWQIAAGGSDHDANPLGMGQDRPAQLIYPDDTLTQKTIPARAAALGPIPPHWAPRSQYGGTYDAAWERTRAPMLPADFDPAFWQVAPQDQQLDRDALADDPLVISGIDGAKEVRSYALPRLDLDLQTKIGSTWHHATAELQTLHLDLVNDRATVTYAARWPLAHTAADVDIARSVVMLGRRNTYRVSKADLAAYRSNAEGEIA